MLTVFVITFSSVALSRIIENWAGMSHFSSNKMLGPATAARHSFLLFFEYDEHK